MDFASSFTFDTATLALQAQITGVAAHSTADAPITPPDILDFLARLRMVSGVPFNNIVPDAELLPVESIRFFFLDRAWTDALVQGALSVATTNSIERAQLEALYPKIESEIDDAERRVRAPGSEPLLQGTAGLATGFLLRSAAVAGWPGMHVRAYKTEPAQNDEEVLPESHASRIKILRMERLAPAVLLVLFDGAPSIIHIEEPRQGVQFGTRLSDAGNGKLRASVPARNTRTSLYVDDNGNQITPADLSPGDSPSELAADIAVGFRRGAAGVVDMTNTAKAFRDAAGTNMTGVDDDQIDGAEYALQMIRFPYRQVFAQSTTTPTLQDAAFKPTIKDISKTYSQAVKNIQIRGG